MKKAIGDSIQIDPDNPWIVDSKGRHRNLTAILDWPESCSDEEEVGKKIINSCLVIQ